MNALIQKFICAEADKVRVPVPEDNKRAAEGYRQAVLALAAVQAAHKREAQVVAREYRPAEEAAVNRQEAEPRVCNTAHNRLVVEHIRIPHSQCRSLLRRSGTTHKWRLYRIHCRIQIRNDY